MLVSFSRPAAAGVSVENEDKNGTELYAKRNSAPKVRGLI
jgi:hypothetical protein